MNGINKCFIAVLCLVVSLGGNADEYHYDNFNYDANHWEIPKSYRFDFTKSYVLDPTNEYADLKTCKEEPVCVLSELFKFVVPKKELKVGQKWAFGEQTYEVKKELDFKLMGMEHRVKLLEKVKGNALKFQYFYSMEIGLVAFTVASVDGTDSQMYILREESGIGSQQ